MKMLITGAGGQLGRELIRLAGSQGHDITPLKRASLDISDFNAVSKAIAGFRPDVVVNCAAYNDVDGAESNWEDAFLVNGMGVKHLALATARHDAVLVHFSSDYVFDGDTDRPYTIADVPSPVSAYGQSKLVGEEMLRDNGDRYFLIRTSWVFGEGKHSFPLKVLHWASKNRRLRVVEDQVASPTYAADLAEAVLKLVGTGEYGLYHITGSGYCSRYEWAKYILGKKGLDVEIVPANSGEFPLPARRPAFSVLDNFPLAKTIGALLPSWQDATGRFLEGIR